MSDQYDDGIMSGWAEATQGTLRALTQINVPEGGSASFMSNPLFIDRLFLHANSNSTTYRFSPTIHLEGDNDWNGGSSSGPVEVDLVQWVRRANDSDWTIGQWLTRIPQRGHLDEIVELAPLEVPADEWFNYSVSLYVNAFASPALGDTFVEANYAHTATVVGYSVLNDANQPVNVQIQSESGAVYDQNTGISTATPEPAAMWLMVPALAVGGLLRKRLPQDRP